MIGTGDDGDEDDVEEDMIGNEWESQVESWKWLVERKEGFNTLQNVFRRYCSTGVKFLLNLIPTSHS